MHFQILQVILWRRGAPGKRVVNFVPGTVNVISGASKTGKSAVIPIIDYCLASDRCAIPVGVIRESCEWFGVLIDTIEGQKLLARREPGEQKQTSDMFVIEETAIQVPDQIQERNSNAGAVKALLNRIAGLSNLGMDPQGDAFSRDKPSFRDLVAFTFQPQSIIANPDVLYFKADTTEHREKLKALFPYVLNAITAEHLALRWEVERLMRILRRKDAELKAALSALEVWKSESAIWLRRAVEFGLLSSDIGIPDEWPDILHLLRQVANARSRAARPTVGAIDRSLERLAELRKAEVSAAELVSERRQRLAETRRLAESSEDFGSAKRVQRDRLALSQWLSEKVRDTDDAIVQLTSHSRQNLALLIEAMEGIELELQSHPQLTGRLDQEQLRLRTQAEEALAELASIRQEIGILEQSSEKVREAAYSHAQVERFLGSLQQAMELYDRADVNAELRQEIDDLRHRIEQMRSVLSETEIQQRLRNARSIVEGSIQSIVPGLDGEWPDAAVELVIQDLTLRVIRGNRDNYLWEIGSGANWLAYHVGVTLALQRFFLAQPSHPVPGLLMYDQPSQVYFPRHLVDDTENAEAAEWGDEDVLAVRKVFETFAKETIRARGRLQIVVLDHADKAVWGNISGVRLAEEWRGDNKLVPKEWIATSSREVP